jgi:acetolactate synthase-1/2/3 large subunit
MIRLADYIAETIANMGLHQVFMLTGGGAMHLNDGLGRHPGLNVIFNHHEQAGAMAADAYARITGRPAVLNVTTGPGGINALNGVFGAWTDSIPMLVISGQVKRSTCMGCQDVPGLRQLGDQEVDIISMAKGVTKYAVLVDDPQSIRYHLEKAVYLATSGRPGPTWIDVPIDVQSAQIDPATLPGYNSEADCPRWDRHVLKQQCQQIISQIQAAARPVVMVGTGVRLAGAMKIFAQVIRKLGVPVVTAWTGADLMGTDDPLYCGRPGTIGNRAGNFTVQNADLVLIIGSRLNIRQVSYDWSNFARHAFKIQVDVDEAELRKPMVKPDMPVHCDAKLFLEELDAAIDGSDYRVATHASWVAWCRQRLTRYPCVQPHHRRSDRPLNPYHFLDVTLQRLAADDVIVCANATPSIVVGQVAVVKEGQRILCNSGSASMGYDLPAAIGATVARGGKRVICLAGDGSIQMNIQELQTIAHYGWPIKIFVFNNNGYLSIRQTQTNFFGRMVGESPQSGVTFPDFVRVAEAYGIAALRIESQDFVGDVDRVLQSPGPVLCEVVVDPDQVFEPKTSSKKLPDGRMVSAPLEDMWPFLDREELLSNLLIPASEH